MSNLINVYFCLSPFLKVRAILSDKSGNIIERHQIKDVEQTKLSIKDLPLELRGESLFTCLKLRYVEINTQITDFRLNI